MMLNLNNIDVVQCGVTYIIIDFLIWFDPAIPLIYILTLHCIYKESIYYCNSL